MVNGWQTCFTVQDFAVAFVLSLEFSSVGLWMVRTSFVFVPQKSAHYMFVLCFISVILEISSLGFHCLHFYLSYMVIVLLFLCRYKTLDVKNILLETVSHHILPQMLASPFWADSTDILRDYLRFMDDHFRESADLTFLAYRHRSYSKVSDLRISSLRCLQF